MAKQRCQVDDQIEIEVIESIEMDNIVIRQTDHAEGIDQIAASNGLAKKLSEVRQGSSSIPEPSVYW